MKKLMTQRMSDGSIYRILQDKKIAYLEHHDASGLVTVIAEGELSFVEKVFAEKTVASQPVAAPVVASEPVASEPVASEPVASEPVVGFEADCQHDPCTHPDCDCQPAAAAVEPAPFAE